MSAPGQALVETALVLPVLLLTFLGMAEGGFLFATVHGWQTEADILAGWAATHAPDAPGQSGFSQGVPGQPWTDLVASESALTGCDDASPVVLWSGSGTATTGDVVTVTASCDYRPRLVVGLWDGLRISVTGQGVIR